MYEQLFEPFGTWDVWVVAKWYVACVAVCITIAAFHKKMGWLPDKGFTDAVPMGAALLLVGFIVPILEELIFRGIPAYFGGEYLIGVGTVIWIFLHGKRSLIIAPMAIPFFKLWTGGFGVEATVLHILHNSFLVALFFARTEFDAMAEMEEAKPRTVNVKSTVKVYLRPE